jgi:hypothetical protein
MQRTQSPREVIRQPSTQTVFLLVATVAVLGSTRHAEAQLKGHYIPGFTGMQNGSQAPPGISLFAPGYYFTTDTLKNDEGDELTRPGAMRDESAASESGNSAPGGGARL